MVAAVKRVLVVDDEGIVRVSYKRALTEAGYTVRTVGSGRDALEACRSQPFDVMLADLRMPDMDGLQVSQAVMREFPDVRVVIITGYPNRESAERASQLGIFDYLEKPLSPERLAAATAAALASPPRRKAISDSGASIPDIDETVPESEAAGPDSDAARPATARGPEPEVAERQEDATTGAAILKGIALLAVAPFIGLAYAILFPLIGFITLFAAIGSGLAGKLGWMPK